MSGAVTTPRRKAPRRPTLAEDWDLDFVGEALPWLTTEKMLQVHPQNLLELCSLGCCGKLFTGGCPNPLQNHLGVDTRASWWPLEAAGCCVLWKWACGEGTRAAGSGPWRRRPPSRSPLDAHTRSRAAEPLPPARLSCCLRTVLRAMPTGRGVIFKGLWPIITAQARQNESGA